MSDGFNPDIFVFQPKSKPSAAGSIWKGGARERADDVLLFRRNKRTSEQSGLCSDVAQRVGFEPTWDCSQTDFEGNNRNVVFI